MKNLRQLHLYLGCVFAPLIIYFSLSGAWQVFRWNNVPKDEVSATRSFLHELSQPHTHSTLPGRDPKTQKSVLFNYAAAGMGLGMGVTSIFGILIALRYTKQRRLVLFCLIAGLLVPICLLFF